ncbi:MAG: PAS domain S-box protein, partial [Thiohalocapsa sp.]
MDASNDPVALLDARSVYRAASPAYLAALGITRERLIGRRIDQVPPAADALLTVLTDAEHCLDGEKVRSVSARDSDGGPDGNALRYVQWFGAGEGQRRAKIAAAIVQLLESNAREFPELQLPRLLSLSPHLLGVLDIDGRICWVNPAWNTVLGYDRDSLIGRQIVDLIHPEDSAVFQARIRYLSDGVNIENMEVRFNRNGGGQRALQWSATAVLEKRLVYVTAHDVTEQKSAQTAVELANRRFTLLL